MTAADRWTVMACTAEPGLLSEGPRWDSGPEELLWVDVLAGWLYRGGLDANGQLRTVQMIQVDRHLGAAALWDGGALARYHPDGSLAATVPLPVDRPTSCAFGGTDRATLFVTTARHGLDDVALTRQPDAGRLLRLDSLGATGPPCLPYRGWLAAASG